MIQRLRAPGPDGHDIVRDVDFGGGPFGDEDVKVVLFAKGSKDAIPGATPVAHSIEKPMQKMMLDQGRNARWRARRKALEMGL